MWQHIFVLDCDISKSQSLLRNLFEISPRVALCVHVFICEGVYFVSCLLSTDL